MINKLKGTRRCPGSVVGQSFQSRTDNDMGQRMKGAVDVDQQLKAGTFSASLATRASRRATPMSRVRVRLWKVEQAEVTSSPLVYWFQPPAGELESY